MFYVYDFLTELLTRKAHSYFLCMVQNLLVPEQKFSFIAKQLFASFDLKNLTKK